MPDGKGKGSHHGRDEEAFKLPGCPSIFLPSGLSLRVEDGTVSLSNRPSIFLGMVSLSNHRMDRKFDLEAHLERLTPKGNLFYRRISSRGGRETLPTDLSVEGFF